MSNERRRVEFGLIINPRSEISDQDLSSLLRQLRHENPGVGESMISGKRIQGHKGKNPCCFEVTRSFKYSNEMAWRDYQKTSVLCGWAKFIMAHWYVWYMFCSTYN